MRPHRAPARGDTESVNRRLLFAKLSAVLMLLMALSLFAVMLSMNFFDWFIAVLCAAGTAMSSWALWKFRKS